MHKAVRTQADRDDDLAIGRELERKDAEIDRLRAALWPFAMKALHGSSVCEDDFRRAGDAMPNAPDHVNQQKP